MKEEKRNQGFLFKFSAAIGFRKLMTSVDHFGEVFGPEISSPEDYASPEVYMIENIQTPLEGDVIALFPFEDKTFHHPTAGYSYHNLEVAHKAQNYFQKVFPDLVVELIEKEETPRKGFVKAFIEYCYRNLTPNGHVTLETSSERYLTAEEIKAIEDTLSSLIIPNVKVIQHECNTCIGHSEGKRPIHVGLDYEEVEEPQ